MNKTPDPDLQATLKATIAEKKETIESLTEQLKKEWSRKRCPCEFGDPCKSSCTCARHSMSGGCLRCCTYGSEEQQKAMANRIIKNEKKSSAS
jgi:hypothetical protein